jgi:hypothetical protein
VGSTQRDVGCTRQIDKADICQIVLRTVLCVLIVYDFCLRDLHRLSNSEDRPGRLLLQPDERLSFDCGSYIVRYK